MIKIVCALYIKSFDEGDSAYWQQLDMVPASGTLEIDEKDSDAGGVATATISARLRHLPEQIRDNLQVMVHFCNGKHKYFGTKDLPVKFTMQRSNTKTVTATYKYSTA